MKTAFLTPPRALLVALALAGCSPLPVLAQARDDVDAGARTAVLDAARRLAGAPGYRWTTTAAAQGVDPFGQDGVTTGQTEKAGFTRVALPAGAGGLGFVTKSGKVAVLLDGSWRKADRAFVLT